MDNVIKIYSNKQASIYLDPSFILLVVIVSIFGAGIPFMPDTVVMRAATIIVFFTIFVWVNYIAVIIADDPLITESFILDIFGLSNIKHVPQNLPSVYEDSDYTSLYQHDILNGQIAGYIISIFIIWALCGIMWIIDIPAENVINLLYLILISAGVNFIPLYGTNTSKLLIANAENHILRHNAIFALSFSCGIITALLFRLSGLTELALLSATYSLVATYLFISFHFWGRKDYRSYD